MSYEYTLEESQESIAQVPDWCEADRFCCAVCTLLHMHSAP